MAFTVTLSLQTNLLNRKCGPRLGLAGKFHAHHLSVVSFFLFFCDFEVKFTCPLRLFVGSQILVAKITKGQLKI